MRRVSVAIVLPTLIPVLAAFWVAYLYVTTSRTDWKQPHAELKSEVEQSLLFAFSPLISWVNAMEKAGPPDEQLWTQEAHRVITESPELLDIAWVVSEQGNPKIFRQESRTEMRNYPLEKMDSEIFSFVKRGERPYGFVYREGDNAFFEFQIPLQSGPLFHGILMARYSLPQFLATLSKQFPPNASMVLWRDEEVLTRSRRPTSSSESFFIPLEIWGKRLNLEVQTPKTAFLKPALAVQWLGFFAFILFSHFFFLFRTEPVKPAFDTATPDWFRAAAAPKAEEGPLPVWAIAQKERIAEELEKTAPPTEKP